MTLRIGQIPGIATALVLGSIAAACLGALGCGASGETYNPNAPGPGSGGTGGAPPVGTGGTAPGTGGASPPGTGGTPTPGTGGTPIPGTGGSVAGSGGVTGSGGRAGTGGVSAPGTPGVVIQLPLPWMDNFDANAVGGPPAKWAQDLEDKVGKWLVVMDGDTKVLQEQAPVNSVSFMVGGDSAWADQKVEAKVKFTTVTSSALALVAARFVSFDNYYFLHLKGDGSLKIRKRIMIGSSTSTLDVLSYKSGIPLTAGTWYTVAIEIKGNIVTAHLNGTAVATVTEPAVSIARGGIALGFQDASGGAFDEVRVTQP